MAFNNLGEMLDLSLAFVYKCAREMKYIKIEVLQN